MGQQTAKAVLEDVPPEILEEILHYNNVLVLHEVSLTNRRYRDLMRDMVLRYHARNMQEVHETWLAWDPRKNPLPVIPALDTGRHLNRWFSLKWLAQHVNILSPKNPLFGHKTQCITREQRRRLLAPLFVGTDEVQFVPGDMEELLLSTELEDETWTWPRLLYHTVALFSKETDIVRVFTDAESAFLARLCAVWAQPAVIATHLLVLLCHIPAPREELQLRSLLLYTILVDRLRVDVTGWTFEWSLVRDAAGRFQVMTVTDQWPSCVSLDAMKFGHAHAQLLYLTNDLDVLGDFCLQHLNAWQSERWRHAFPSARHAPKTLAAVVNYILWRTLWAGVDTWDTIAVTRLPAQNILVKSISVLFGHHYSILLAIHVSMPLPPRTGGMRPNLRLVMQRLLVANANQWPSVDLEGDPDPFVILHTLVFLQQGRWRPDLEYQTGWSTYTLALFGSKHE